MTRRAAHVWIFLGLLVPLALSGCEGLGYTNIGDVLGNPSQYDGKEVKIRGKVIDVMKLPFLETKLYVVKDDTGEILVVTTAGTPAMGSEVRVRGVVDTTAIIGDKSVGLHLRESQRW